MRPTSTTTHLNQNNRVWHGVRRVKLLRKRRSEFEAPGRSSQQCSRMQKGFFSSNIIRKARLWLSILTRRPSRSYVRQFVTNDPIYVMETSSSFMTMVGLIRRRKSGNFSHTLAGKFSHIRPILQIWHWATSSFSGDPSCEFLLPVSWYRVLSMGLRCYY